MKTFEDICKENKEANNGFLSCSLSNFKIVCNNIQKALKSNNLEKATDEMCSLTSIFKGITDINYNQYRIDTGSVYDRRFKAPSKNRIQKDFNQAKEEIESFICKNYKSGAFEITKEVLFELPYWCVDWSYYNQTKRRFIDACKMANEIIGYKGDEESSKEYAKDKDRWHFTEIFCSHYNGGRVTASFENIDDCLQWSYHSEAIEEDGLFWAEQPCY